MARCSEECEGEADGKCDLTGVTLKTIGIFLGLVSKASGANDTGFYEEVSMDFSIDGGVALTFCRLWLIGLIGRESFLLFC